MKKYNLTKIMKRAWAIKKENVNNIFSICLKMAWGEEKVTVEEYLVNEKGLKTWEKKDNNGEIIKKRIYINDISKAFNLEKYTSNAKGFRCVNICYDVLENSFTVSGSTSSRNSVVNKLIEDIKIFAA